MNRGEPVAVLVPFRVPRHKRKLGFLKGKGKLRSGWDKPFEDFADYR
jgi:hypothetical protein